MEQYVMYLRKSRFDRDYAEFSVEETLKRHKAILDKLASERGYRIAKVYYEVVSGESIAVRPQIQEMLDAQLDNAFDLVEQGLYTKEEFRRRKEKITGSQKDIQAQLDSFHERLPALKKQDDFHESLILQTEELPDSYEQMTAAERDRDLFRGSPDQRPGPVRFRTGSFLRRGVQHGVDEDAVPPGGVVHQHVCNHDHAHTPPAT